MARILVAEDEELVRRMLVVALRQKGHRVEAVGDGDAAFRKLQEGEFDLLLTDFRMPRMTGLELIRAAGTTIPSILMSSNTLAELGISAHDLPGVEFLRKPFGLTDLYAAIARATRKD